MSAALKLAVIPASPTRLEPGDILTLKELAGRLKVNPSSIYKLVEKNTIPYMRVGRFLRFVWPEVLQTLRTGKG